MGVPVKVLQVKGDKVQILSGTMKIWVNKADLEKAQTTKPVKLPQERKVEVKVEKRLPKKRGMAGKMIKFFTFNSYCNNIVLWIILIIRF
jgi:hypothetical protein